MQSPPFRSARSAREARDDLKRSVGGQEAKHATHRPQTNPRSSKIVAGRYDKILSGEDSARPCGSASKEHAYNYGEMLYMEALMASGAL